MLTFQDMLIHNSLNDVPLMAQQRMEDLQRRVNMVLEAFGEKRLPTNVFRSMQYHLDLYRRLGKRAPLGSKHLTGDAADLEDHDGHLYAFCQANPSLLERAGLYCELDTKGWVHFQQVKFGSYRPGGTRWFRA